MMRLKLFILLLSVVFCSLISAQEKVANAIQYKLEQGRLVLFDGRTGWSAVKNTPENLTVFAFHTAKPEQVLAAVGRRLYVGLPESGVWNITLELGKEFQITQLRHAGQRWWEVWMAGKTTEADGSRHSELWASFNGGISWELKRRLSAEAEMIRLTPESKEKYEILNTPATEEKKP